VAFLLSTCNEFLQRFYKTCITCWAGYLEWIIVCSLIGLCYIFRQNGVVYDKYQVLNHFRHLVCRYDTYEMVRVWNIWLIVQIFKLNHWLEPLVCPCWKSPLQQQLCIRHGYRAFSDKYCGQTGPANCICLS